MVVVAPKIGLPKSLKFTCWWSVQKFNKSAEIGGGVNRVYANQLPVLSRVPPRAGTVPGHGDKAGARIDKFIPRFQTYA